MSGKVKGNIRNLSLSAPKISAEEKDSSQNGTETVRRSGRNEEEAESLVHTRHLQQRFGISAAQYDLTRGIEMRVVFIAQRSQPL